MTKMSFAQLYRLVSKHHQHHHHHVPKVGDDELLVILALYHQRRDSLSCCGHLHASLGDPEGFLHLKATKLNFYQFWLFENQLSWLAPPLSRISCPV